MKNLSMTSLKLSQLCLSPENMRKASTKKTSDNSLRASIKAQGIIQNLIVSPKNKEGLYPVEAGGRRFVQCLQLIKDGHYTPETDISVRIVDVEKGEKAKALSLSENYHRTATNPVDDFEAFTYLNEVDEMSVTDISKQFGVTKKYVEQRLALGAVAPKLLELGRSGKLDLELLEAFSIGDDHKRQVEVYELLKNDSWRFNDTNIRSHLTNEATSNKNKLVKYVTVKDYKKAGGVVITDLFGDNTYIADQELFDSLLAEKIEKEVLLLEKQWGWVDVDYDINAWEVSEYLTIAKEFKKEPKALISKLNKTQARLNELDEMDQEDENWTDKLEIEWREIDEVIDEIEEEIENQKVFKKDEMKFGGCILTVNSDGELVIYSGLVKGEESDSLLDYRDPDRKKSNLQNNEEEEVCDLNEPSYSQALLMDLSAYKKSLVKAALIGNTALSADLAMFSVCFDIFVSRWNRNPLELSLKSTAQESSKQDISSSSAQQILDDRLASLDRSWITDNNLESFKLFRQLSSKTKKELLAYCASVSLRSSFSEGDEDSFSAYILGETGFQQSEHFRPTKANFFGRLKGESLENVKLELLGEEFVKANLTKKPTFFKDKLEEAVLGSAPEGSPLSNEELKNWMPEGF